MNDAMQAVTKALTELKPPEPAPAPTIHVDVHVPEQPAPIVQLRMPKILGTEQVVNRNRNTGAIESTTVKHRYEDD